MCMDETRWFNSHTNQQNSETFSFGIHSRFSTQLSLNLKLKLFFKFICLDFDSLYSKSETMLVITGLRLKYFEFLSTVLTLIQSGTSSSSSSYVTVPPLPQNAPAAMTIIHNRIEIVDISQINIENQDFRVDFYIQQMWTDEGIDTESDFYDFENEPHITGNDILKFIWAPDFFIPNARVGAKKSLSVTTTTAKLFRNKTVILSARLWAVFGCQMSFQWYPMDAQGCEFIIESFSYPTDKVLFVWNEDMPIVMPDNIELIRYQLRLPLQVQNSTATRFGISENEYSNISVLFLFERLIGNHLIKTYIPTFLIVCLSWFSFWMGMDAIPGRISLLVTAMLTLVTMFSGFNKDVPPVTYVKMIDIWMVGCMVFVFAAIFEFVVVKYIFDLGHSTEMPGETEFLVKSPFKPFKPENDFIMTKAGMLSRLTRSQLRKMQFSTFDNPAAGMDPTNASMLKPNRGYMENWKKVDKVSTIVFPMLFAIFTIIYVPVMVICSEKRVQNIVQEFVSQTQVTKMSISTIL